MNSPADTSECTVQAGLFVRIARALSIDRAVGFAVLARFWQLLTGPVTQLLIVLNFSGTLQGYYYAFSYLLGMQIFVELGLHVVIISISSHEWSKLTYQAARIEGDASARSRLRSLDQLMFRWYASAALLFTTLVMVAGIVFFRNTGGSEADVAWQMPWLALVVLTGLQLPLLPKTAILEGCHQLGVMNRVRFYQAVAGTVAVWILIVHGGLWALPASAAVRLLGEYYLVRIRYRSFFDSLNQDERSETAGQTAGQPDHIDWTSEILPLQWRIAIQGVLLWCVNGMPGLVIFRYHGEVEAGRLGMTWTILTALQSASMAWLETRRPLFGSLIAARRFSELDGLFFRLTRLSMGLMSGALLAFSAAVWWLSTRDEWLFSRISQRLLPLESTLCFALALMIFQFALCTNLYVRAHKRDPFLAASVISSVVTAALEFWLGRHSGTLGVATGYLLGIALIQVPLWTIIWWTTRRAWHRPEVTHG